MYYYRRLSRGPHGDVRCAIWRRATRGGTCFLNIEPLILISEGREEARWEGALRQRLVPDAGARLSRRGRNTDARGPNWASGFGRSALPELRSPCRGAISARYMFSEGDRDSGGWDITVSGMRWTNVPGNNLWYVWRSDGQCCKCRKLTTFTFIGSLADGPG